eukprot:Phypoly_transcript_24659.p2 GENE.Phypoly_transcript_24659~~Phypoly_transcript_24659.p2  ORF type:complete len:170 (+),score=36.90 Phypoly_transcript_24659:17-526(+)
MKKIEFELYPPHTLHLGLFEKVTNASHILSEILSGKINFAVLNPQLIVDEIALCAAANRAMHAFLAEKLTTKSIHSELIFNLSPNKNISDSLKKFGLQTNSNSIIVAIFDATPEKIQEAQQAISGEEIPFEQISKFSNFDLIAKEYQVKIKDISNLQREVINAIAIKGL